MGAKIIRPKTREAWLELRKGGIGSSEVATILGLNRFETPFQLWMRKTGQLPPEEENMAMKRGHWLEDAVAQYYQDATGRQIIKRSAIDWIVRDAERPWMQASPDRTYWIPGAVHNSNDNSCKGICEIKTTRMDVDPEDLPLRWVAQATWQMGIGGWDEGSIAWLDKHMDFGHADLKFDPDFFLYMREEAERFWRDCVQGGREPLPVSVEDILLKNPGSTAGKSVVADAEIAAKLSELAELQRGLDEMDARKKALADEIKLAMGDAESLVDVEGRALCTWKTAKATREFDKKRFMKENPDLYARYVVEKAGSRRFLVK